ncbi:MAG: hypothetical protein Q8P18_10490 [Pseudomonadota bacterium]|nr:hypothetical protein [Pseudomonadota bacterium]
MFLLPLLACAAPSPSDTAAADAEAADTGSPDTGADADTAERDEASCDATMLGAVAAGPITVDWSAKMPLDRADTMVLVGSAAEMKALACAAALTQGDVQEFWSYDAAHDAVTTAGSFDLTPFVGGSLFIHVSGPAGDTAWFVDIESAGAAALTLE